MTRCASGRAISRRYRFVYRVQRASVQGCACAYATSSRLGATSGSHTSKKFCFA
jgi:hypothetical protein